MKGKKLQEIEFSSVLVQKEIEWKTLFVLQLTLCPSP